MRLISACSRRRRNRRGRGLPACGRGVTVPISTKLKPSGEQARDRLGILVEAGGQPERMRELEAQEPGPEPGGRRPAARPRPTLAKRPDRQAMRGFGRQPLQAPKQERAGQLIEKGGRAHSTKSRFSLYRNPGTCEDRGRCAAWRGPNQSDDDRPAFGARRGPAAHRRLRRHRRQGRRRPGSDQRRFAGLHRGRPARQGGRRNRASGCASALGAMGLGLPPKRITVNLAPADLAKEGSHFDLPIALGLLVSLGACPRTRSRAISRSASWRWTAASCRSAACCRPRSRRRRASSG